MATTTLEIPPASAFPAEGTLARKRWTRNECRQLVEAGVLAEGTFELIGGDIVPKMTQHERHVFTCKRVREALEAIFGADHVRAAAPIALETHEEPEPDAAVVTRPAREYLRLGTPLPEDVRLAVEVSDSTLVKDLTTKNVQYGEAGIAEYWVVDLPNRLLHVFRRPVADGYAAETVLTLEDEVHPLAAPGAAVRVADLLP